MYYWTGKNISNMQYIVEHKLLSVMCVESAKRIADVIVLGVVQDISETAGREFNDNDVRLAIGRVLEKRLGIKY